MTLPLIRTMTSADIPAVVAMIAAFSAFHDDPAAVTTETLARDTDPVAPWMHVFVAELDGQLIGYMVLLPLAEIANGLRGLDINHIFVAEDHRSTGIARQFVESAKAHALSLSCTYMFISTSGENTAAQAAYQAIGFAPHRDPGGPRFRLQL